MSAPLWQDVPFSTGPSGLRSRERQFGLLWLVSVEGRGGWAFCIYRGPGMTWDKIGPMFDRPRGVLPCPWPTRDEAEAGADAWAERFSAALVGGAK